MSEAPTISSEQDELATVPQGVPTPSPTTAPPDARAELIDAAKSNVPPKKPRLVGKPVDADEVAAALGLPPKPHTRSLRKRMATQAEATKPRVRSQALPATPRRDPPSPARREVPSTPRLEPVFLQPPEPAPPGPWRWTPWAIALAVVAWIGALLLLTTNAAQGLGQIGGLQRVIAVGWGLAAFLTFAPLQWRLHLGGLTWQGIFGWGLLGYLLAWAPPPTNGLLDLPETPVYLLLFLAVFYAVAAAVCPIAFLLGQRLFSHRLQRLDVRRARRQGYEAGVLAVAVLAMAGLRVLTPLTGILLVVVMILLETLLLSQMRPEG